MQVDITEKRTHVPEKELRMRIISQSLTCSSSVSAFHPTTPQAYILRCPLSPNHCWLACTTGWNAQSTPATPLAPNVWQSVDIVQACSYGQSSKLIGKLGD